MNPGQVLVVDYSGFIERFKISAGYGQPSTDKFRVSNGGYVLFGNKGNGGVSEIGVIDELNSGFVSESVGDLVGSAEHDRLSDGESESDSYDNSSSRSRGVRFGYSQIGKHGAGYESGSL